MAKKVNPILSVDINNLEENYSAKNKTTIAIEGAKFEDITSMAINDEGNIIITAKGETIEISDHNKLRYIKTLKEDGSYLLADIINAAVVDNKSNEINTEDIYKKIKVSGTNYNDVLNLIAYDNIPETGKYKNRGLIINAGAGNDEITGTVGNDTITGGLGDNTIYFKDNFGIDTINLTKGENLTLDLSDYGFASLDDLDFEKSGKNLKIIVKNNLEIGGTIILKNYLNKNVVGTNGSVNIKFSDLIDDVNLNTSSLFSADSTYFKKAQFIGTRFSETIDASGITKGSGKKGKSVLIDAKGGYNTIIGTNGFNDTIKGGNDGNKITAKDGNKTITTGSSDDIIEIIGDGVHTIKAGNGENNIKIIGDGKATITTGSGDDTIYVENYLGKTAINAGSGENNITIAGDSATTIKSGKDNDIINISGNSTSTIYAGSGENTININNSDIFGNHTLTEEKANAINTISFSNNFNENYHLIKNENDLIIKEGANPYYEEYEGDESSITIKDYFKNNKNKANYKFVVAGIEKTFDQLNELLGGLLTVGKGTIKGTDKADTIYALGNKTTKIYAGKGDDTIYGNGNSLIYFYEGDGHDRVSGDTFVFKKGTQLSFEYSWTENSYTNFLDPTSVMTIRYGQGDDYITGTPDYIQIGNKKRNISSMLKNAECGKEFNFKGTNKIFTTTEYTDPRINLEGSGNTLYALGGDDYIHSRTTNVAPNTIYAGDGKDMLIIMNTISYGQNGNDCFWDNGNNVIYGGKGNDYSITLDGSEYHFSNGDGNDTIEGFFGDTNYVFDDEENIVTGLNYTQNGNDVVISYNNSKDSITLHNTGTYIGGSANLFNTISNKDYSQIIYCNKDNKIFNISSDGTIKEKWAESGKNTQIISANGTPLDKTDDTYLDLTNLDTVKAAVAGWLTERGYADVDAAIKADGNNQTILSGAEYFGALEWKPINT